MPDISMCGSTDCQMRETCRRNEASGTKPSEFRQAWFMEPPIKDGKCEHYWPLAKEEEEA